MGIEMTRFRREEFFSLNSFELDGRSSQSQQREKAKEAALTWISAWPPAASAAGVCPAPSGQLLTAMGQGVRRHTSGSPVGAGPSSPLLRNSPSRQPRASWPGLWACWSGICFLKSSRSFSVQFSLPPTGTHVFGAT